MRHWTTILKEDMVDETKRILKPDGKLVVVETRTPEGVIVNKFEEMMAWKGLEPVRISHEQDEILQYIGLDRDYRFSQNAFLAEFRKSPTIIWRMRKNCIVNTGRALINCARGYFS